MSRRPLYEYIGDPILVLNATTNSSDGTSASDNSAGVPVGEASGCLMINVAVATDANDVAQWQIQYSSTGNASDAATSNAGWTCTDAIFATGPAATAGAVHSIVDVNLDSKAGFDAAAGKLFVTAAAAETGAATSLIIGIPYGGTRLYPATNAVTVVHADA